MPKTAFWKLTADQVSAHSPNHRTSQVQVQYLTASDSLHQTVQAQSARLLLIYLSVYLYHFFLSSSPHPCHPLGRVRGPRVLTLNGNRRCEEDQFPPSLMLFQKIIILLASSLHLSVSRLLALCIVLVLVTRRFTITIVLGLAHCAPLTSRICQEDCIHLFL